MHLHLCVALAVCLIGSTSHGQDDLASALVESRARSLADSLDTASEFAWTDTLTQIERLGAVGAPSLVGLLADERGTLVALVARSLGELGAVALPALRDGLGSPDARVRANSAILLGDLGAADDVAVQLLSAVHQAGTRIAAAYALATTDDHVAVGLDELVVALQADDPITVRQAVSLLRRLGPVARVSAPALAKLAGSGDRELQLDAALAMSSVDPLGPATVDTLVELFDETGSLAQTDRNPYDDLARFDSIGLAIASAGGPGVALLVARLDDARLARRTRSALDFVGFFAPNALCDFVLDPNRSEAARLTLTDSLGGAGTEIDARLLELLAVGDEVARHVAAAAMGQRLAHSALDGLAAARDDESPWVRSTVAWALARLADDMAGTSDDLFEEVIFASETPGVESADDRAARHARRDERRQAGRERALDLLVAFIQMELDRNVHARAVDDLIWHGEPAARALGRGLAHPDPRARAVAADALGLMGPDAAASTDALVELTRDPLALARVHGLAALYRVDPSTDAVPRILDEVLDGDEDTLDFVRALLRELDPVAVDDLIASLGDTDPARRMAAAWGLSFMEAARVRAADALRGSLDDTDALVRINTAGALLRADPGLNATRALVVVAESVDSDPELVEECAVQARTYGSVVVGWLERILTDVSGGHVHRAMAARLLGGQGAAACEARDALRAAGDADEPRLRDTARKALNRLGCN